MKPSPLTPPHPPPKPIAGVSRLLPLVPEVGKEAQATPCGPESLVRVLAALTQVGGSWSWQPPASLGFPHPPHPPGRSRIWCLIHKSLSSWKSELSGGAGLVGREGQVSVS